MTSFARLRHLLAFLLILGIGATPLAASAAAPASGMSAMASMEAMADGMPCCPDDAAATPDCQKSCPLLAVCMTKCAPAAIVAIMTKAQTVRLAAVRPGDDAARPSPDTGPPSRPPRS